MKNIFASLMSDAASAALLAVTVLVIALGTVLPQQASPATYADAFGSGAARIIAVLGLNDAYHSWFLLLPAALLGVNMFRRARGTALSFSALVIVLGTGLVLFGALYGRVAGREGMLPISVGESKDIIYAERGGYQLPFSVCLDDFSVEQEGGSIENFRSSFRLMTGNAAIGRGTAEVNRPFRFAGYSFYQQAYDPQRPRWTGLKVVKDPGVTFVFLGLILFNAGIISCVALHLKRGRGREMNA